MNKVIAGYFDDAHRGLQRQRAGAAPGPAPVASSVQLPPLRPSSEPLASGGNGAGRQDRTTSTSEKVTSSTLQESKSLGSLDFSYEQASRGVQAERYQQTLQENAKLVRKVRSLQEQLAITAAKKEAFKAQAQRLEREFRKGREQSELLQKDLLEARREAGLMGKEAQDALDMMTEMRKAHMQEVRLLQRGLANRGSDEQIRNRVNEMADLVDKVGRAVLQRDEALRDRTRMQAQLHKAVTDLRALSEECERLRRHNKQLGDGLKEARRRGQYAPPKLGEVSDDSDEEFESELQNFERRFEILEEGPAGLDILASNLSQDKQNLEKRVKMQQDTMRSLNETIENWKLLGAQKDQQIRDLTKKVEKVMKDMASLEEQIAQKQRDIAQQVAEERAALEARVNELELECDNARAAADGMEKASTRLTRELVKVHEAYAGAQPPGADEAERPPP